jgi:hypothetical protein
MDPAGITGYFLGIFHETNPQGDVQEDIYGLPGVG